MRQRNREKEREAAKRAYHANREEHLARKRARAAAMTPEERAAYNQRKREEKARRREELASRTDLCTPRAVSMTPIEWGMLGEVATAKQTTRSALVRAFIRLTHRRVCHG